MNCQGLQTDKLVPIELPEICAPRTELLNIFAKASGKRCIYINAPAGCGKTVSALLWIQKSGVKPIWLGLDAYDNTPAAFYRFFCTALFSVIPQEESLTGIVKAPDFSASPVEYTIEVISRLSFNDSKYVLVFDDFHFITNEEIAKSLLFVIKRLPLTVTILILSRSELPRTLYPLNEDGKVAFIGASELAFKSGEIRRHFASFGRFITAEEAKAAFSLTEGWAIAVGALALSGGITDARNLKKGGLLDQYIKTQIWDKFDDDLRRFMVRTSVVDEFSVELCGRLTQKADAGQVLDMLRGGNLFISRQEDRYRFHSLFLDFLRGEAGGQPAAEREGLCRQAAGYYLEKKDYFNALRYFVKTEDSKAMAAALYGFLKNSGQSISEIKKIYFINELRANVLEKNPFLYISCAFYSFLFSDVKSMYFYFDRTYERIHDIEKEYSAFLEGALLLFTIDTRYSFMEQMARFQSEIALKAANRNLPKTLRSLGHNLPYFHRTFRDFSHYALNMEEHFAEFRLMFFALLGNDYKLIESGVKSGLLYEKNLLKEAAALVEPNPETDSAELAFLSKMQVAAILLAMGKHEEAVRCREDIKSLLERENLLYLLPVFSAYETRLELQNGNKAAAESWLENYFVTEGQSVELSKSFLHFTTARAYIVLGNFDKARILCEKLMRLAADFHRELDEAEAAALLAVILWLTGEKQEAAELLKRTLNVTEPYRFIRVFADEGRALLPILKKLLKRSDKETDPYMPGYRYLQELYLAAYAQSKRHKGIACAAELKPIKLSKQQKYVLELLAKGYKNAEIIELTGLSINTIRAHTKVAYQKLEVNNMMDAVLRARELGLIE